MVKNGLKNRGGFIAALDVGTTKVCCVIARVEADNSLRLVGVGHQVSKGMRAGGIVDMEGVEISILNAVHQAEQAADCTVREIYVNVVGGRPISQMIDIEASMGGNAVEESDIKAMLEQGQAACHVDNQEIIHAFPLSYTIDQNEGIRDPRGMFGETLSLKAHILKTPLSSLRNLATCIHRCHLDIAGFVMTPYASGLGVLVEDEMDLGAILLDVGGGSTHIAAFLNKEIIYADMIPLGGDHITSDIARGLSTPLNHAERLKILYGSAVPSVADERELVAIPQVGENDYADSIQVTKAAFTRIIQPRVEEIFEMVGERLVSSGINGLVGRRLVMTGGASQMFGMKELASQILDKQVRLAKPLSISRLSEGGSGPSFSTCAGLLIYALQTREERGVPFSSVLLQQHDSLWEKVKSFSEKFKEWFG